MGRLLAKLLREVGPPANPANVANVPAESGKDSQNSEISSGGSAENAALNRHHLLNLCGAEGLAPALVHGLSDADLDAAAGLGDAQLCQWLHLLERRQRMDAGHVPGIYAATAHCAGCGPICWHRPERLLACPWCLYRIAGRPVPRPLVSCGDCRLYLPDTRNPTAGTGTCTEGHGARWPMQQHRCPHMQPAGA